MMWGLKEYQATEPHSSATQQKFNTWGYVSVLISLLEWIFPGIQSPMSAAVGGLVLLLAFYAFLFFERRKSKYPYGMARVCEQWLPCIRNMCKFICISLYLICIYILQLINLCNWLFSTIYLYVKKYMLFTKHSLGFFQQIVL